VQAANIIHKLQGDDKMKPTFLTLAFLFSLFIPQRTSVPEADRASNNIIQLALLLDTSNSMDGLIDQAKSQLWKIVNELATSNKDGKPVELFVALYEYGKDEISRNEGHLRNIVPFTRDLDKISEELFKLRTNGGEEFCGKVILSAVENLRWEKENENLKVIFIAGNEPFTQGDVDYKIACRKASERGIIVNTIFCGSYDEGISTMWKDGADLADGTYMNIDQNQEIVHINAPQDEEIIRLGIELNKTYIVYGIDAEENKVRQEAQDKNSLELSPGVMVERSVTKSGGQYNNSSWDLVDAYRDGAVDLKKLESNLLPEEMKSMNEKEKLNYIKKMQSERKSIQNKIMQLNEERNKYIAKKMVETGNNTLDAVMINTVKQQAEKKNFKFK
jgi:hypothetical protein